MTQLSSLYSAPAAPGERLHDPRRWLYVGLGVMFALIGVGLLLAVLYPGRFASGDGHWPFGNYWFPWGLFFLFFVFFWWIPRWGWSRGFYGRRYWRNGNDPAHSIARERYARGEISKEQYDQLVRDLD